MNHKSDISDMLLIQNNANINYKNLPISNLIRHNRSLDEILISTLAST